MNRTILVCDLCPSRDSLASKYFATDRFTLRSLSNGGTEYSLDLCNKHAAMLREASLGSPSDQPAWRKRGRPKATIEDSMRVAKATPKRSASRSADSVVSCKDCGKLFPSRAGLTMHEMRVGHGGRDKIDVPLSGAARIMHERRMATEGSASPKSKVAKQREKRRAQRAVTGFAPNVPYRPGTCEVCGSSFDTSQGLALHRTKTGHRTVAEPANA